MTYFIIVLYKSVHVMKFRLCLFFFKQKTAYEMRISDWSSDVCSSDLDPLDASDPDAVLAFEVLGASPAKSTRPWLALAVRKEAIENLTVDGERFDLGTLGPDRAVVGFRGTAILVVGGVWLRWVSGCAQLCLRRIPFFGEGLRGEIGGGGG